MNERASCDLTTAGSCTMVLIHICLLQLCFCIVLTIAYL